MADRRPERMGEMVSDPLAAAGRPASDEKTFTWRTLVICVVVAVGLSVTATLLLGGGHRFPGAGAWTGCGAGAITPCSGEPGAKAR